MSRWNFVTDFGDSAVTVPLALLVLGFLAASGARRAALGWGLAIGGTAAAIGALKLIFGACGGAIVPGITSPSGHTAMSTAVYGALAALLGARLPAGRRLALYGAATIAIVAIGWSRVALHDHTRAEIAIGFVVGAAGAMLFGALRAREPAPALPLKWLLLSAAAVIAVMHGTRWMVEPAVHRLAWDLRLMLRWCR